MKQSYCRDKCNIRYGGAQFLKKKCLNECYMKNDTHRSPDNIHKVQIYKSDHHNRDPTKQNILNNPISSSNFFPSNLGALINK